jgi:hypothetical protein
MIELAIIITVIYLLVKISKNTTKNSDQTK